MRVLAFRKRLKIEVRRKEKKEEIDFIVEWFKNIKYCEFFFVYSDGGIDVLLIIIKQKRIQREKDFTKIKNIVLQNSYDIRNNWYKDNTITILHRFKAKEVHPLENPEIREIMGNMSYDMATGMNNRRSVRMFCIV